jgi:hypothetical protein
MGWNFETRVHFVTGVVTKNFAFLRMRFPASLETPTVMEHSSLLVVDPFKDL